MPIAQKDNDRRPRAGRLERLMKMSDIFTKEEIAEIKRVCFLFHAQWVEYNGVRYVAPKMEKESICS